MKNNLLLLFLLLVGCHSHSVCSTNAHKAEQESATFFFFLEDVEEKLDRLHREQKILEDGFKKLWNKQLTTGISQINLSDRIGIIDAALVIQKEQIEGKQKRLNELEEAVEKLQPQKLIELRK